MNGYAQVFVLGAPRSGTTFLSSLLQETRFGAPFETHFIPKYHRRLSDYGELSDRSNLSRLMRDILSERPVQQWKLNMNIEQFYDDISPDFSYANIINSLISLKRSGAKSWGDKTPSYLSDPDLIHALFPDAKYIFIVRDGRDVALSLLKKPWGPNNIMTCARYWAMLNRNFFDFRQQVSADNLFILKYEDLLGDTEGYIRSLHEFLGEQLTEKRAHELAQSVQRDNFGKWRSKLSTKDLRIFEAEAGEQLKQFDYPLTTTSPSTSSLECFQYSAHEKWKRLVFLFNANVIDGIKIRFFGKEPFNE